MDIKQNFVKSILSGGGTFIIKAGLNVLLIPIMMAHLGMENYGFYLLIIGMADFLMLMDVGLTTGLIKQLCHYSSTGQPEKVKEQLRIGQYLYAMMVLVLIFIGFLATPVLVTSFSLSGDLRQKAIWIFPLVMIDGAINLYGCYFQSILKSRCIYHWANIIELIQSLLINGGSVLLLLMGYGLIEMMVLRLIATLLKNIIFMNRAMSIEPNTLQWGFGISKKGVMSLFSISMFAMVQEISVIIAHRIDDFVIAAFLTLTDVSCFGLVSRIFGYVVLFCIKLTEAIFPMFAHLETLERSVIRQFFLRVSSFINYVILMPLILVLGYYPEIIRFLSANKIHLSQVWGITLVFVVLIWSVGLQIPASKYLFACGKHRYQAYSSLITALCNLGLSLFLIRHLGLLGIALGTLIPHVIQHQLVSIRTSCQLLEVSFSEYLSQVHFKNIGPVFFFALSLGGGRLFLGWTEPSLTFYIPMTLLFLMGSIVIWVVSVASKDEQQLLYSKLASLFGRRSYANQEIKV